MTSSNALAATAAASHPKDIRAPAPPGPASTDRAPPVVPVAPVALDVGNSSAFVPAVVPNSEPVQATADSAPNIRLIMDQYGSPFAVIQDAGNAYPLQLDSKEFQARLRLQLKSEERRSKFALKDITDTLKAEAELSGERIPVWRRVAPIDGGIAFDLGNDARHQLFVRPGSVEVVTAGSTALFLRSARQLPMPVAPAGNPKCPLLRRYVVLDDGSRLLFLAWVTYTLAHPKVEASKYVILLINGPQGSGKSVLTKLALQLVDANQVNVQTMPTKVTDLAIAAQNGHVLAFDNLRGITHQMSDTLCMTSTGGAITQRQLFTDADQVALNLHVALILNGIPAFVDQPDLLQRCLPLRMKSMADADRRSESEILAALETDLPQMRRDLFELIAQVLVHLPSAKPSTPMRMIDFSRWLCAMAQVLNIPPVVLEAEYADALNGVQLDALMENSLAAAVISMINDCGSWKGTPTELLQALEKFSGGDFHRSRDWPANSIALSKRLLPLVPALSSQGLLVELGRGKERTIEIRRKMGGR